MSDPAHRQRPLCLGDVVTDVERKLRDAGVAQPLASAQALLAALLDRPGWWSRLRGSEPADARLRASAMEAAGRLARGAPLAYAARRASFRHLTLMVDERVLIPRPETEVLVEVALALAAGQSGGVAVDVGTGSGAIAIALATEGRFARVVATDVSLDALDLARANIDACANRLAAPIELRHESLLGDSTRPWARLVVSNPPYIAFAEARMLPALVRDWEPPEALYSPDDGLAITRQLIDEAALALLPAGALAIEVDTSRAHVVRDFLLADSRYGDTSIRPDLTGRPRVITARRVA